MEYFCPGLEFEDSWNSNNPIPGIGDIVTYGGYNYVNPRANTHVIYNTTDWEILSTGFKARGYYDNATAYSPDLVRFGGHSYTAKVDTTEINQQQTIQIHIGN